MCVLIFEDGHICTHQSQKEERKTPQCHHSARFLGSSLSGDFFNAPVFMHDRVDKVSKDNQISHQSLLKEYSIEELRSAANTLSRTRLKNTAAQIANLDSLFDILEEIQTRIHEFIGHPEASNTEKRKRNMESAKLHFTTSKRTFDYAKDRISTLLESNVNLAEEYIEKFLILAGKYYVKSKILLLYTCGHIPEDVFNSRSVRTSPLSLTSLPKNISHNIVSAHHRSTDIHHIDKRSYLGNSIEPLLFKLEQRFHGLIHKVTDNDEREVKISRFAAKAAYYGNANFRSDILEIERRLQVYNVEYANVLMQHPNEMEAFTKIKNPTSNFSKYLAGVKPHFRKLRNTYALEMTERFLDSGPYFMRNISEAHHFEIRRHTKLHLEELRERVGYGLSKFGAPHDSIVSLHNLFTDRDGESGIERYLNQFNVINEYKPFQISPTGPWQRKYTPVTTDNAHFNKILSALSQAITALEGEGKKYWIDILQLLRICYLDVQNCKESSTIGKNHANVQKEYHTREKQKKVEKPSTYNKRPRRPSDEERRESKRKKWR